MVWREDLDLARSYNNRPILDNMADCEVLERFRLSRACIKWLTPVIFDPVNFPGNLPGNLREVVTSRKVTGESQMLQNQTKWRAGADFFV